MHAWTIINWSWLLKIAPSWKLIKHFCYVYDAKLRHQDLNLDITCLILSDFSDYLRTMLHALTRSLGTIFKLIMYWIQSDFQRCPYKTDFTKESTVYYLQVQNITVWENHYPNSTRFCRPICIVREKENRESVLYHFQPFMDSIQALQLRPFTIEHHGHKCAVWVGFHRQLFTY